jgi:hypothetical protein
VQLGFNFLNYIFEALLETRRLSAAGVELPPSPIRLWSSTTKTKLGVFDGYISRTVLEKLSDWFNESRSLAAFGSTIEY